MTQLPLELISILNLMRINFFIGQAPVLCTRTVLYYTVELLAIVTVAEINANYFVDLTRIFPFQN